MKKIFLVINKSDSEFYSYEARIPKVSIDDFVADSGISIEVVVGAIRYQCERNGIHCAHSGSVDLYDSNVGEYIFNGTDIDAFTNCLSVLKPMAFDITIINE